MIVHTPSKSGEKRKSLRRSVGLFHLDAAAAHATDQDQESPLSRTPSRKRHQPLSENMIRYWRSNVVNSLTSPVKYDQDTEDDDEPLNPRASTATLTPANVAEFNNRKAFEQTKPHQAAFSSCGLVSKSERRPTPRQMPETPCKRRPESLIFDLEDRPDSSRLLWTDSPFSEVTRNVESFHLESPTRPLTSTPAPVAANRFMSNASTITPGFGLRKPGLSVTTAARGSPPVFSGSFATPRSPDTHDSTYDTWDASRDSHGTADTSLDSLKAPFGDTCLQMRFRDVQQVGSGEFSCVWSVSSGANHYAVKRTKKPLTGTRQRARRYEEVEILKLLNPGPDENILQFIDSWEDQGYLYIMTEFCENGSLDAFLNELGTRIDEWRVWKILADIATGLRYIHDRNCCHLDLKPANILITFEGNLKIGDFGMATLLPAPRDSEREGDREYIAPEVLNSGQYDTPADIFSLGIMMVEIAANIILPDNGEHWQKLRSGDLSDAGRLSSGDLKKIGENGGTPSWAPYFMIDDSQALDRIVRFILNPEGVKRPTAAAILAFPELQLVESRRQAGAIVYEGDFGPEPNSKWAWPAPQPI